ncbi:hypothetical protein, partial [Neobacillus niacini]|uniref:hypothetical protein n=1 Tax=Neobacillus niacini TaxID=86668 RepID=UPI0005EEEA10
EVKLLSADGSWDFVPVRVGRCQANEAQPDKGCAFLCSVRNRVTESPAFFILLAVQGVEILFDSQELAISSVKGTKTLF